MAHPFEKLFNNMNVAKVVKKTYKALGIDVERLPIQFASTSAIHGIRYNAVRVPYDIIISHGPISGSREYFSLLHTLGEACYFAHIDDELPYVFRRYAPEVLGEGFATLSSWLMWEYSWLREFTSLEPDQIEKFSQQMKNYELLKLRYFAGFALFEMDAYRALEEDLETDLDALFRQRMEMFHLVPPDDQSSVWAAEPLLIDPQSSPLFAIQILGFAVAATLIEYFHEENESSYSRHFGTLIQSDLVQKGASTPWLERLQQFTSKALTPFPISWSRI